MTSLNRALYLLFCIAIWVPTFASESVWQSSSTAAVGNASVIETRYRITKTELGTVIFEYRVAQDVRVEQDRWRAVIGDLAVLARLEEVDKIEVRHSTVAMQDVLYFSVAAKWPMPSADVVIKVTEGQDQDGVIWREYASMPAFLASTADLRFLIFNVRYEFLDLGNGKARIAIKVVKSPPFKLPKWLVTNAFPKASVEHLGRLTAELNSNF